MMARPPSTRPDTLLVMAPPFATVPRIRCAEDPTSGNDAPLKQLQQRLLVAAGSGADDWNPIAANWLKSPAAAQLATELGDRLGRGSHPLKLFQDPQIARLLALWRPALARCSAHTAHLLAFTSPQRFVDTAADALPAWHARLLWLRLLVDAEAGSRGRDRWLLAVDSGRVDWEGYLAELGRSWSVEVALTAAEEPLVEGAPHPERSADPTDDGVGVNGGEQLADPDRSPLDPDTEVAIAQWCEHAWTAYQALAKRDNDDDRLAQLDQVRGAFDAACTLFGRTLWRQLQTRAALLDRVRRGESEAHRLAAELDNREAEVDRLTGGGTARRENLDAALLRLNALQTSAAWQSAKPVHWLERRRPALIRRLLDGPRILQATLRGRLGAWRRQRAIEDQVRTSGLFDLGYYIRHNPDAVIAGQDPLRHWLGRGWRDGRNPHPLFDTGGYLRRHPSLADSRDDNPIRHYLHTAPATRWASPLFDSAWYLDEHPEARSDGLDPLLHYLRIGAAAGMDPSPLFDQNWYLAQSPDLVASGANPLVHYLEWGAAAGRDPCPLFSSAWYLQRYPDVAAAGLNPLAHFVELGADQDRDPGPLFDTAWYRRQHPEIDAEQQNPLAHYLHAGIRNGVPPRAGVAVPISLQQGGVVATLDDSYTLSRALPPWQGDWTRLPLPPPEPAASAPPAVLIVDERHPTPDLDSGSYRMRAILDGLRDLGAELLFVGDQPAPEARYVEDLEDRGVRCLTGRKALLRELVTRGDRYRSVILSRPGVCERYLPLIRAFAPSARLLYDTVDLHWVRLERGAAVADDPDPLRRDAQHYRRVELSNAQAADLTIAISADERQTLLGADPTLQVAVIPNIHRPVDEVPPYQQRRDLFFLGAYGHAPNVEAAHFLVERILPAVAAALPDVRLHLVGSAMPDEVAALASDRVVAVGYVPQVDPYFRNARLFVAPLLHGAGMKGKVGQSLSYGLPVVTTAIGAEGIGLEDGVNALIANDPDAIAERIVRCYRDPDLWQRLSVAGRRVIAERFSPDEVRRRIEALVLDPTTRPAIGPGGSR